MYFKKKLEVFVIIFFILASNGQHLNAIENKILFKVNNEIITSIDIYDEIKFLKAFNPEMNSLNNNELFEISKNSILRDKIKKIEIMNFVEELIVDDKFILNLIRKKYSKLEINSIKDFENYLNNKNLEVEKIKEKFTIELIWSDFIYRKFNNKIKIDKEKIKKEILQNPPKDIKEILLSEITFNASNKDEFENLYKKIILNIEKQGFKKTALMYSDSDTSSNGGLIGWIQEDNLNQNIKRAISELQLGELSKPIRTSSGFIILRVEEEKYSESTLNLDDKVKQVVNFKINDQLNQFSNIHFNKIKKNMRINGL